VGVGARVLAGKQACVVIEGETDGDEEDDSNCAEDGAATGWLSMRKGRERQ
jgi:hypothetical protein